MVSLFKFEKLFVYQKAIDFSIRIYKLTTKWPSVYLYNIKDQLIRSSLSISLNIAEGSGRTNKDFCHFLSIARGSAYECIPLITIAFQLKLIDESINKSLYEDLTELAKMLSGLKKSIQ